MSQTRSVRRIGRTIVSERVRATIQQNREQARHNGRSRSQTRKTCRTKDSIAPKTVKSRLAGRLGITTPPAGRTLPVKVSTRSRALTIQRDIGIAPLTIMAGRDDLDPAWSDSDTPSAPRGGGAVVLQGGQAHYISSSRYTKAALNSRRPIPRPHIR
ncbi:hypothetical protein NP493_289g01053 [Ridgeia piscesae]|uniref:Uncharacterized protein n=1 Tax=Ridgeia piscesae TaxID=27915 RepID=A0AAD9NWI8_RIDPI|nr:hypothetical protein NP493_289g01053 [Ridgeia piscesae]